MIDADKLKREWEDEECSLHDYTHFHFLESIDEQPTIEAEPIRHGKWEYMKEKSLYDPDEHVTVKITSETCSACGCRVSFEGQYIKDVYCPNCGAKMDKESICPD